MKNNAASASPDDFSKADISGLDNDVPRSADSLEEAATTLTKMHVKRVKSDLKWRERLLWTFMTLIIGTGVLTFGGLIYLMITGEFNGNVAIAFFTTVVVQVVGLTLVVAKFFFPEGGGNTYLPTRQDSDTQ